MTGTTTSALRASPRSTSSAPPSAGTCPTAADSIAGFPFRGARVPFLSTQKGIFRAAAQRGPAALAIQTSAKSPYDDGEVETGFRYAYRAGSIDQPDNRALRAAHELRVPLVYFVATRPGWYRPSTRASSTRTTRSARSVVVSPDGCIGAA